jgi:LysM repeat protein
LRLAKAVVAVACCAGVIGVACGSDDEASGPPDLANVATATLPAQLPEPLIVGGGAVQPGGQTLYTVQSGDSFAAIAERYGYSVADLQAANPGVDTLQVGQTIRLPAPPEEQPTPAAPAATAAPTEPPIEPLDTPTPEPAATNTPTALGQTYIVKSGDIPQSIAAQFGITVEALLAANPGINPNNLQVGQALVIPPAPPE